MRQSAVNQVAIATYGGGRFSKEPAELISTIRDLLNQTMVEYNKQNCTGGPADFADVAYIDNFEFLEAPLAEEDEAADGRNRNNAERI